MSENSRFSMAVITKLPFINIVHKTVRGNKPACAHYRDVYCRAASCGHQKIHLRRHVASRAELSDPSCFTWNNKGN